MEKCGENRRKLGETKSQGSEDSCLQGVKAPYFKGECSVHPFHHLLELFKKMMILQHRPPVSSH